MDALFWVGFILLKHDIVRLEDFGGVIDILTQL